MLVIYINIKKLIKTLCHNVTAACMRVFRIVNKVFLENKTVKLMCIHFNIFEVQIYQSYNCYHKLLLLKLCLSDVSI